MALLPLDAASAATGDDTKVSEIVREKDYRDEREWWRACLATAERIGKCVPFPRVIHYRLDPARGGMSVTVEHRP